MAHHVRVLPWEGSKSGPHPPHGGRIEKAFAGPDALFHPPVMVLELTAAAAARELSRVGSPPAQGADELDQVVRQSIRLLMAPRSGRAALQPSLGEPRQRELAWPYSNIQVRLESSVAPPALPGIYAHALSARSSHDQRCVIPPPVDHPDGGKARAISAVRHQSLEGGLAHLGHFGVGVLVVPVGAGGLLKCPCPAACPLKIAALELAPEQLAPLMVQEMPGARCTPRTETSGT